MGSTRSITTSDIVAALAQHAGLDLTSEEREQLVEHVTTVWDMAETLRMVASPGLEGLRNTMPLRTAKANRSASGPSPTRRRRRSGSPAPVPLPVNEATVQAGVLAIGAAMRRGDVRPIDVVAAFLERIRVYDTDVRSYITVDTQGAMDTAEELGSELARARSRSVLHGVPFGVKDSIPAEGMPTTYNSPLMRDWFPARDSEPVRRLRAAGAVLLGKHNLNEFGWSLPSEGDLAPPPRNPFLPDEASVGSSSGSAAAVSAGLTAFALGTDAGGSVRLPAGQHRLFGLKPGLGVVPRTGVGEMTVSEVGVLARSAPDAAVVLAVLLLDPDSPDVHERLRVEPLRRAEEVVQPAANVRLGVPWAYIRGIDVEPATRTAFEEACRACEDLGWEIVDVPDRALSLLHDAVRANFVVIAAEHFFDHEGTVTRRERYGERAGFYALPGCCLTAADYLHARRVGRVACEAVDAVLDTVDALLTPTGRVTRTSASRNPATHRSGGNAVFTAAFNVTGHPAVSVPAGASPDGLPIGVQLVGRPAAEFTLLRLAHAIAERVPQPPFPDLATMRDRLEARHMRG